MSDIVNDVAGNNDVFELDNPSVNLAEGSIVSLSDLQDNDYGSGQKLTTYHWRGQYYPIKSSETVAYLARHILNYTDNNNFTRVILNGKSGTGKSTFTRTLCHRIHKQAEERGLHYIIRWYRREAIGKIDQIIQMLPKGLRYILVFEDASWGDRDLTEQEAHNVMARLTYIRHDLQSEGVIFMIQTHFSKALGPFMRDGEFLCLTSISHVERQNYHDLFGKSNHAIVNQFFKKYGSMNAEGYWYSDVGAVERIKYYTKKPFKLSLVSDSNQLHFTQYPAEGCGYCEPHFEDIAEPKFIESESEKELFKKLGEMYGVSRLRQALRYFAFFRSGAQTLEPKGKALINHLISYYEKHPNDWQNTSEELKIGRSVDQVLRMRGMSIKRTREEERRNKRSLAALQQRQRYLAKKQEQEQQEQTQTQTQEGVN